jgi:hypothetical protein
MLVDEPAERPPVTRRTRGAVRPPSDGAGPARAGVAASGLGSARASTVWAWVQPAPPAPVERAPSAPGRTALPMPPELLRAMAAAAAAAGRSQSSVWAEAARAWLRRHTPDDDPPPPPGAAAAPPAAVRAARERTWTAIDILLNDLRYPDPGAPPLDPAA